MCRSPGRADTSEPPRPPLEAQRHRATRRTRPSPTSGSTALGARRIGLAHTHRSSCSCIGVRRPHSRHRACRIVPWSSRTDWDSPTGAARRCSASRSCGACPCVRGRQAHGVEARCRGPHGVVQTLLPRIASGLRVGHVGVDVDQTHRGGVRRPHAVRTSVVGDARLRADAGAGEHRDGVSCLDHGSDETKLVCHAVIVQGCSDTNSCSPAPSFRSPSGSTGSVRATGPTTFPWLGCVRWRGTCMSPPRCGMPRPMA